MSIKEKAVMGAIAPAMSLLNALAPELNKVQPLNPVSQFVHDNIQILLMNDNSGKSDDMGQLLTKIAVAQANDNPDHVLSKLLCFYENFRVFYGNSLKTEICELKPEPEPESKQEVGHFTNGDSRERWD